ncbi:hypothetical protein ACFMBG_01250 [Leisingera sp. D0M16]|uniref:hypothetical protein n=1 Tax=Leisingera coralii TaxID=3351347 RepID=UPI003B823DD8
MAVTNTDAPGFAPKVSQALEAPDSRPLAGILFLLLATTLFPIQDVIIKSLSGGFAVHQIVFWRGLFALPIVAAIAWYEGTLWPLKLGSIPLQLLRAAAGFSSYLVYYMALAAIGLAETAAITFYIRLFVHEHCNCGGPIQHSVNFVDAARQPVRDLSMIAETVLPNGCQTLGV